MGISMHDSKLRELARLISEWPGLVAAPDLALIEDSLVLLDHLGSAHKIVDVGSGAGLPGLPLKLARPHLGLEGVEIVARRAEEAGQDPRLRESFDAAVARALAPMPVLVELCLPLVRVGGRLLAQKTENEDMGGAQHAIDALGGSLNGVVAAPSAARGAGTVVIVDKVRPTPPAYPRRAGLPARKPL